MNIETAIATVRDQQNFENRELILAAATVLAANSATLTERVIVPIAEEELTDAAWADVIAGSATPPCSCGRSECETKLYRVFGPAVRTVLVDGATVVVGAGKSAYLRLIGTTNPIGVVTFDEKQGAVIVSIAGDQQPQGLLVDEIDSTPAAERTFQGPGADGLGNPVLRVESVDLAAEGGPTVTVVLDNTVEEFAVRTDFIAGETVVLSAGKQYLLRVKGTDNVLRAYWIDAERGGLVFQDDPLNPHPLAALFNQPKGFALKSLSEQLPSVPVERRTFYGNSANGLPVPLLRIDAVSVLTNTVTVVLDQDIEAYNPPVQTLIEA